MGISKVTGYYREKCNLYTKNKGEREWQKYIKKSDKRKMTSSLDEKLLEVKCESTPSAIYGCDKRKNEINGRISGVKVKK